MQESPVMDNDHALLVRARRWRQQHIDDSDNAVYLLVTELEAALRAEVEELPVA